MRAQSQHSSQTTENGNHYMLSISEYEEIARRLEDSHKQLDLVLDAIATPENLENLRPKVEQKCDRMTLRVKVVKLQDK